jgi:hypothetical protein
VSVTRQMGQHERQGYTEKIDIQLLEDVGGSSTDSHRKQTRKCNTRSREVTTQLAELGGGLKNMGNLHQIGAHKSQRTTRKAGRNFRQTQKVTPKKNAEKVTTKRRETKPNDAGKFHHRKAEDEPRTHREMEPTLRSTTSRRECATLNNNNLHGPGQEIIEIYTVNKYNSKHFSHSPERGIIQGLHSP